MQVLAVYRPVLPADMTAFSRICDMERYFVIEPEVAGGIGERSMIDRSTGKMKVEKPNYHFEGWLGDHLLESTPCYIVSTILAR